MLILIDDLVISTELIDKKFVCNLEACKGACCVEGDTGAYVEEEEALILERDFDKYKDYLTAQGLEAIAVQGFVVQEEEGIPRTPLIKGKDCVYICYDEKGIAGCGIEKAWADGKLDFRKPVSCHLYPIRVSKNKVNLAVNYEEWDICSEACVLGEKLQVPIYKFCKDALIRKFGEEVYELLETIDNQKMT